MWHPTHLAQTFDHSCSISSDEDLNPCLKKIFSKEDDNQFVVERITMIIPRFPQRWSRGTRKGHQEKELHTGTLAARYLVLKALKTYFFTCFEFLL